jgi:vitamin B12 transporter
MPSAWIPANKVAMFFSKAQPYVATGGEPGCSAQPFVFHFFMSTRTPALRGTIIAVCASLALQSFAAENNSAQTLETTVVTAGRIQQNLNDVIADMTIVDRETIEKSGANSVADILARQPGIELVRNGGAAASTSLYVRGAPNQYTAVLIDGVRVDSQAGSGGVSWNSIPTSQIDHIEILRGPCAAVYGSDAMAGVIQIFTRQGRTGFHPSLEVGLGTDSTQKLSASVVGGTEVFDYALAVGYDKSKGFDARPNIATANHDRDGYLQHSGSLKLGWNINAQHRLEFNALDSRTTGQYDATKNNDLTFNDTRTQSLAWNAKWTDQYKTRVAITRGTDRYETRPSLYATKTHIDTYLWHNEYRTGIHQFTADVERREDKIDNTSLSPKPKQKRSQNALALGYGLSANGHNMQINLRQDDDSDFGRKATGSIGYAYSFGQGWRISASTGTAFRAPSLYQRFSPYGKPGLAPEQGRTHELGLRWAEAGNELGATIYQSRYSNQIIFGPAGSCASLFGCYTNVAKTKNTGLTLVAATRVQDVRLGASLDLQAPKDVTTNKLLPRRAKRDLKLTADTQVAGVDLGAEVQAVGKRFDDAANKKPLKNYTLLNVSAKKSLSAGWDLIGRIDNLGDKTYETAGGYATGGRQLYIGLRWTGQ